MLMIMGNVCKEEKKFEKFPAKTSLLPLSPKYSGFQEKFERNIFQEGAKRIQKLNYDLCNSMEMAVG